MNRPISPQEFGKEAVSNKDYQMQLFRIRGRSLPKELDQEGFQLHAKLAYYSEINSGNHPPYYTGKPLAGNYYSFNMHRGPELHQKMKDGTISAKELALLHKLKNIRISAALQYASKQDGDYYNDFSHYHMSAMVRLKQEQDMAEDPIRASLTTIWNGLWWQLRFAIIDTIKETLGR